MTRQSPLLHSRTPHWKMIPITVCVLFAIFIGDLSCFTECRKEFRCVECSFKRAAFYYNVIPNKLSESNAEKRFTVVPASIVQGVVVSKGVVEYCDS